MKRLFAKKRALEYQIKDVITRNESRGGRRITTFRLTRPLSLRVRALDQRIDQGRRELTDLVSAMLEEVESLARHHRIEQAAELIRATRMLAELAYEEEQFNWVGIKNHLNRYRRKYASNSDSKAASFCAKVTKLSRM